MGRNSAGRGNHATTRRCLRCNFKRALDAPRSVVLWFDPGCA